MDKKGTWGTLSCAGWDERRKSHAGIKIGPSGEQFRAPSTTFRSQRVWKRAWILEARAQLFEGRRISLTHGWIIIPIPNSSVENNFLFILIHCFRSSKHQILGKKNQQEFALKASKIGVKFLTNPGLSCFKQPAQGLKMGMENNIFWSETRSGFEKPGGKLPIILLRSAPPPPPVSWCGYYRFAPNLSWLKWQFSKQYSIFLHIHPKKRRFTDKKRIEK